MPDNEKLFFRALNKIVGPGNLKAKSIGVGISASDVFLDKDFRQYEFPESIRLMISSLLSDYQSNGRVGTGSLSHHVDGLIVDHPDYGTRIVEFDEEQHFNTFRATSLHYLSAHLKPCYLPHYHECCRDLDCFNRMLRKHRLKAAIESVPETPECFVRLVQSIATPENGYIEPKTGFQFVGGRIAQRSYYDTLRDVAHIAPRNQHLSPPLRMTIFEFESASGREFHRIPQEELQALISIRLNNLV